MTRKRFEKKWPEYTLQCTFDGTFWKAAAYRYVLGVEVLIESELCTPRASAIARLSDAMELLLIS